MTAGPVVFVVDDDGAVRDALGLSLKMAGHAVEVFESAAAFLASGAHSRRGCLITDIRMPDMDGLELQQELVRRKSTMPVIVITGHGDVPLAVRAMKAGAGDFLEKPFPRDALLAAVKRALDAEERAAQSALDGKEMRNRLGTLTPREREVFDLVVAGKQSKTIAHELGASPRTIEVHRGRVMRKMKAGSLQELVRMALAAGA
ncbi:MAG TPA: response regulator FixJ [Rhizomicrobium sp.]|jgi:two-component system response regulator FixJ|nr:response regulator FixJ [Rhizomicrobium sp.]